MNIIVLVKPVPDPEKYNLLRIDPVSKRLVREGIPTIVNPTDKNAMEAALKIKEQVGGKIRVLSMTPPFSADRIKECLAMGGDEGYMVSDPAFAGADTFSTSYTLMKAIEKLEEKPDLILAGNESADGATAHVPAQLAEWLGIPHITNVKEIAVDEDGVFRVSKRVEQGILHYSAEGPILFSLARGANQPRLISAMGVVKASKKPLLTWGKEDLDVNPDLRPRRARFWSRTFREQAGDWKASRIRSPKQ